MSVRKKAKKVKGERGEAPDKKRSIHEAIEERKNRGREKSQKKGRKSPY